MSVAVRQSVVAVAVAALLAAPCGLKAQKAERKGGPEKGTWGAEAGVGQFDNGNVLRFVSPNWALLVGGSIRRTSQTGSTGNIGPGFTTSSLQLGARKYFGTGLGLRPIAGAGVAVNRITGIDSDAGFYGEAGATYLFNPHLSLGAVARAGFSRDGDQNTYSLLAPRILAAIYF